MERIASVTDPSSVILLQVVKKFMPTMLASVQSKYGNLNNPPRFGLASFSDKPIYPFGLSNFDYVYQTHLALTKQSFDVIEAWNVIAGTRIRNGRDGPEAQLDALLHLSKLRQSAASVRR